MSSDSQTRNNKSSNSRRVMNGKGWRWPLERVLHRGKTDEEELESPKRSEQWKPVVLRDWSLLLFLLLTLGLIGSVITLMLLSGVGHGFVKVRNWSGNLVSVDLSISLVWIVVPSFVFGIYGQVVAAAIDAFGFRQPFVELWLGAPAAKTIALDYKSLLPGQREATAISNGHWHLVVPFIFSLLLKTVIGPLAARMMVEQPYTGCETITLHHDYALTSTISLTESLDWDLLPVLNITAATKVYNGSYTRWVDRNRTFLSYSSPTLPKSNFSQPRVTTGPQPILRGWTVKHLRISMTTCNAMRTPTMPTIQADSI